MPYIANPFMQSEPAAPLFWALRSREEGSDDWDPDASPAASKSYTCADSHREAVTGPGKIFLVSGPAAAPACRRGAAAALHVAVAASAAGSFEAVFCCSRAAAQHAAPLRAASHPISDADCASNANQPEFVCPPAEHRGGPARMTT